MFRIFLAQQRTASDVVRGDVAAAAVDRRAGARARRSPTRSHDVLDRLVLATQLRFPVVGDLARSVRFRWFDQPLVDAERAAVLAGRRRRGRLLAANPDAPDHAARIDALAAIPEQIVRFLAAAARAAASREREPMLEVLVRRHYREYELHDLRDAHRRPAAVRRRPTTRSTTGRPTWSPRSAPSTSWPTRDAAVWSQSADRAGRRRARPGTRRSSTSTCPGRRRPQSPARGVGPAARAAGRGLPFAQQVRRVAVAVCPGSATARSPTSPSGPAAGRRWSRTTWSAACTRWSGAGSTCGGCATSGSPGWTRPRTCCSTTASPADNEADQRLVALAQVRQFAVVRDEDGQVDLAAARRAGRGQLPGGDPPGPHRARRGRRQAGHEPRLGAHLAGRRRPARRAHRAAAQHRAADRRAPASRRSSRRAGSPAPDGVAAPGRRAVLLPARGRASSPRSSSRRPSGCSRSTTTPRRCCAPAAAAPSTPTS